MKLQELQEMVIERINDINEDAKKGSYLLPLEYDYSDAETEAYTHGRIEGLQEALNYIGVLQRSK